MQVKSVYDECLKKDMFPSAWKKESDIAQVLGEGKDGPQVVPTDMSVIRPEKSPRAYDDRKAL